MSKSDDLISRQAAIDAFEEPCKVSDTWTDECAVGERMQWEKDVKALKSLPSAQQDCTDCEEYDTETHSCPRYCDVIKRTLEEAKQERTGHWIPCSERLPEEGERVLATHLGGLNPNRQVIEHIYQNGEFTYGWEMDTDFHSPTFGQRFMGDVIAWMPLPEAFMEGEG